MAKDASACLLRLLANRFLPYAVLIGAVFLAYGDVYGNQFLLDDEFLIIKNSYLQSWGDLLKLLTSCSTAGAGGEDAFYRPLQGLLYFIVYQISGLSTVGFHLLNVVLHAANACLVYSLGRRLGFHHWAVFAAALLWAVHPVHTEAVTYMSATADPLYALCVLAGLCVLLPNWRIVGGCVLFALALLAKETALVFPLLAMLCLFAVSEKRRQARTYLKTWPLWAVAGVYLALRFTVLHMDDVQFYKNPNPYSDDITARVLTFLATLPAYLRIFLWPSDLHMSRNFPVFVSLWFWPVWLGILMLLGAAGVWARTFVTRGRSLLALSWGLGWFAIAHALHTGVLLPVNAIINEHWLYLPSAGLLLGVAESLVSARGRSPATGMTLVLLFAALLGGLTFRQNTMWRDPIVFYETILRYGDESMNAYNNLGMAYAERGDMELAIKHYRSAIALSDTFAQPHHNIARAFMAMPDAEKHIPEAFAELERAVEINPRFFQSYEFMADLYALQGDAAKAAAYRRKVEEILGER